MKKRIISLFLAMLMICSIIPIGAIQSSAASKKTKAEAIAWINSRCGNVAVDMDGAYGAQCVDFIQEYYSFLGVSGGGGNACDYATNTLPSGFTRIKDYNGFIPEPGDIAIWDIGYGSMSSYGHVGLVISADLYNIRIAEVWGGSGDNIVHDSTYPYNGSTYQHFWGVIRPAYASSSIPATGISLNATQFTMDVGESKTITATVSPSNATNKNVTWSSSNTNAVTVSSSGVVKAVGTGGAVVTAKTVSGGFTTFAEIVVTQTFDKPITSMLYNGHYYELYSERLTWEQAKAYCEKKGGHLATITSEGENSAIQKMISTVESQVSDYTGFYIGLTDKGKTQGDYQWITSEENSYKNWETGEPNNALWSAGHERYQDYVLMASNGKWSDVNNYENCRRSVGFIYEYDEPQSPDAVTLIDGKVYELYDREYTISSANDLAKEKGGYLLSLTSAQEQTAVGNWVKANSKAPHISLGATDAETEGAWKWTSGEKWSYTSWLDGEPNNSQGIEDSAVWAVGSGKWNDVSELRPTPFIIEYTLDMWLKQGHSLNEIVLEELPDGADPNDYEIATEYRSRDKSTTTSTAASMDGWTKYDSKITYGAWSKVQSSKTKPADSDILQNVGTWTQYHYYHYLNYYSGCYNIDSISYGTNKGKHDIYINNALSAVSLADQGGKQAYGYYACSEESPSFNIWFYAGSTLFYNYQTRTKTTTNYFYKWSEWSSWGETPVAATDSKEVETRTVYRLKENVPEPTATVSSISVQSKPSKTVYTVGETFSSSGISIKVNMSDGTSKTVTSGFTVSSPDMTTAGTKTVTVTYEGKTATFNITVNAPVNPTAAQYKISGATATAGSTVEIYVSIENNPGIISLRNKITYDTSVMELVKVEDLKLLSGYTTPSPTVASPYTLRWADSLAIENNTANGNFVKLTFKIKDSAEVGDYGISVSHIESRTATGEKVEFADCSAVIKVVDYMLGDVDGNGEIDDWDAIVLNRYFAGWQTEIIEAAADIDGDGELTDWDAIALERRLAGWNV